jgi:hypothetical protein
LVDKHPELLLNHHGSSIGAHSAVDAQTTAVALGLVQPHLVQPQRVELATSSMSMNFQDLKMQLYDMSMEMYQMTMQNRETSRNIADLKHNLNKNGVGFSTFIVVLDLLASVLAYLFASGLLGIKLI